MSLFRPLLLLRPLPCLLRPTLPYSRLPPRIPSFHRHFTTTSPFYYPSSPSSPSALPKPLTLDPSESQIWDILTSEFTPTLLSVQDISGGCGSMYAIQIASKKFKGQTMLKQQRMVNAALGDIVKGWHGLRLQTQAA